MEDFSREIKNRIELALIANYKNSADFINTYDALIAEKQIDIERVNTYVNNGVAKGISPETAIECWGTLIL